MKSFERDFCHSCRHGSASSGARHLLLMSVLALSFLGGPVAHAQQPDTRKAEMFDAVNRSRVQHGSNPVGR